MAEAEQAKAKPVPEKYTLPLTQQEWNAVFSDLLQKPQQLFLIAKFRQFAAQRRAAYFRRQDKVAATPATSISYTLDWNQEKMDQFVEGQVSRLILPLISIDPIATQMDSVRLLSVGPRNEMELLLLIGLGLTPDNIKAIDLISNSPLVDVGDMHAIPFPDDSFDALTCGWTLPYSRDHARAVGEMIRVTRPGGLIALGLTRIPPGHADFETAVKEGTHPYQSVEELLRLFGEHVDEVPFRHEPRDRSKKGALMTIVRIRKPSR